MGIVRILEVALLLVVAVVLVLAVRRLSLIRAGGASVSLRRDELEITERRRPGPAEVPVIPADATVLRCRDSRRTVELAMTDDVLTGFLSWVEATPPRRYGFRQAS